MVVEVIEVKTVPLLQGLRPVLDLDGLSYLILLRGRVYREYREEGEVILHYLLLILLTMVTPELLTNQL